MDNGPNAGISSLFYAVIERAVLDYTDLEKRKVDLVKNKKCGDYDKEELDEFFTSPLCDMMLKIAGFKCKKEELYDTLREREVLI